jgi:hypothetical protein
MIRDGLLREPERRRGGPRPHLTREQAIAVYRSAEPLPVLMQRYGVSRSVIVSIRGGRNYRMTTRCLKRAIRGFKRITPKQIKLIRTMPGSNRTIGLALGIASSSVRRYRRPGSTRIVSQTSVFQTGRTRWRRLPPRFDPRPLLATPRLIDALDTFGTETVRGFPLVESPTFPRAIPITGPAHAEAERLPDCLGAAEPYLQFTLTKAMLGRLGRGST